MPNITAAGTYSKLTPGFEFLSWGMLQRQGPRSQILLFSDGEPGTSCLIQYVDDEGVARTLENGAIKKLPQSIDVSGLQLDLQIVVTGNPNFNLTAG